MCVSGSMRVGVGRNVRGSGCADASVFVQMCGCGCVHGAVDVWQHVGACACASVFTHECPCV